MNEDTAIDVSVVIPNWNGVDVLARCLDSVISDLRTSGLRYEIIVVDDKSQDDSVHILREQFPDVQIILNSINSGFAFSCNQGLKRARGAFILLLNSDVVICNGAIRRVWEFMSAHPEIGGAGCRILSENGELQKSCRDFPSLPKLFKNRILRLLAGRWPKAAALWSVDYWPHDTIRTVDWIHMVFFMISRRALEVVGELDERFFMYGEDADYGWRLNKAGFKVGFVPDSSVIHLEGYSGRKRWGAMAMVRRQLALHELLRKWYSPYHVWVYRLGISAMLVSRLVWGGIRKMIQRGMREDADFELSVLLLRCNLGLLGNNNEKI
jgi:hypothetical protein